MAMPAMILKQADAEWFHRLLLPVGISEDARRVSAQWYENLGTVHNDLYFEFVRTLRRMAEPRNVHFPELEWFLRNFDLLAQKYPGQWVAIRGEELVAHADSVAALRQLVDARGIRRPFVTQVNLDGWLRR